MSVLHVCAGCSCNALLTKPGSLLLAGPAEVPNAAPATAPSAGIPAAPGNAQNTSTHSMPHQSTPVVDAATPAATPAATSRPSAPAAPLPTQADTAR